jgi:hypothetical protein
MAEQNQVSNDCKWVKTRICGCDECRFFSEEERPVCPKKDEPGAIQLWAINPKFYGIKDYVDPLDFLTPQAFNERLEEEVQDTPVEVQTDIGVQPESQDEAG